MPTPEIMSMKMTADHKYRLPRWQEAAAPQPGRLALRGGVTEVRSATFRN